MEFTEEEKEILYHKYRNEGMTDEESVDTLRLMIKNCVNKNPKNI